MSNSKHPKCKRQIRGCVRMALGLALGTALLSLDGCAAAALPCRVSAAVLKVVPVVGHAVSEPFDACASAID